MSLPTTIDDLQTKLAQSIAKNISTPMGAGDKAYMKFTLEGEWIYGRETIQVEDGSLWAVNPYSLATGFICWADGINRPVDEKMVSFYDDPIDEATLDRSKGEWSAQVGIEMVCVTGEDKGTEVIFKSSTWGAKKAFEDLVVAINSNLMSNQGTDKVIPLVELSKSSFPSKKAKRDVLRPDFLIKKWATREDTLDTVDDVEPEPAKIEEPKPAPKRRRRKA